MTFFKNLLKKVKIFYYFLEKQVRIDPMRIAFIFCLFLVGLIGSALSVNNHYSTKKEAEPFLKSKTLTLSEFESKLSSKQISSIQYHHLNDGSFFAPSLKNIHTIHLRDGTIYHMPTSLYNSLNNDALSSNFYNQIIQQNIPLIEGLDHTSRQNKIIDFIFFIFYVGTFVALFLLFYRAGQDLLIGKSFIPKTPNFLISFEDIVGYEEVKKEFSDVIDRLKYPEKYSQLDMSPLKGILLTGPPGVGKTLFAKALANESSATFLYATGSDFVELYVGVGARRARALFQQARASTPAVIFIDEIDALGSRTSNGMDSERLATINQMLAEMDGMNENNRILVIGATNHSDKLDSALLRPGRFDKTIQIPSPDFITRKKIFEYYLKNSKLNQSVSFETLAHRSIGFSGAQIANIVQQAKTYALRNLQNNNINKESSINFANIDLQLDIKHFDDAFDTLLLGHGIRAIPEEELHRIAIHELGHALIAHLYAPHLEVSKVCIEARGQSLGFTIQQPNLELNLYTEQQLLSQIQILLAGRAAESVFFNSISSGSKDDLLKATQIATHMVCELGFGSKTKLMHIQINPNQSHILPDSVQDDIKDILDNQMREAIKNIKFNEAWLQEKKIMLIKYKTLDKSQLFKNDSFLKTPTTEQDTQIS